jgi:uncharacterized protein (DUF58 family)
MRRKNTLLRNLIVLAIMFLIIYELIDSIRNSNTLGFALSAGSILAFVITVKLARKYSRARATMEEEKEPETTE